MPEYDHDAPPLRVGIIGAGAVGSALLVALDARGAAAGLAPVAVTSRTLASAQAAARLAGGCLALDDAATLAERCDLVFIATSDDAIRDIAEGVAWRAGQAVVHLSGSQGVAPASSGSRARGAGRRAAPADDLPTRHPRSRRGEATGAAGGDVLGAPVRRRRAGGAPHRLRRRTRRAGHPSGGGRPRALSSLWRARLELSGDAGRCGGAALGGLGCGARRRAAGAASPCCAPRSRIWRRSGCPPR